MARKFHRSFKRKTYRSKIRQEAKRTRLENIKALIEYQDVVSSESERSGNVGDEQ